MPHLLLQSLMDLLLIVLCNVHIHSYPLNEKQEQVTPPKGGKPLNGEGLELSYHGNVTVDVSSNFLMSETTVQSVSSIRKRSSEILHFL